MGCRLSAAAFYKETQHLAVVLVDVHLFVPEKFGLKSKRSTLACLAPSRYCKINIWYVEQCTSVFRKGTGIIILAQLQRHTQLALKDTLKDRLNLPWERTSLKTFDHFSHSQLHLNGNIYFFRSFLTFLFAFTCLAQWLNR